jgi:hypothetical protein
MAEHPRRRSKLVGTHPAEQPSEDSSEQQQQATVEQPYADAANPSTPTPSKPVTQNPRRLRVSGRVSDHDRVSFNCKMTRGLRRAVRHYATDAEVDIQDVVAAALVEYLGTRGVDVSHLDLQQPD